MIPAIDLGRPYLLDDVSEWNIALRHQSATLAILAARGLRIFPDVSMVGAARNTENDRRIGSVP